MYYLEIKSFSLFDMMNAKLVIQPFIISEDKLTNNAMEIV